MSRGWWYLLFVLFVVVEQSNGACSSGWESYNDNCYLFKTALTTWPNAESACQQAGGHLTSFADAAERDWVYNGHIGPSGQKWWIGLNDIELEGTWVWSDKSPVNNAAILWRPGEPNNNADQHCTAYEGGNAVTQNTMNDENCGNDRYYICKAKESTGSDSELCDTDLGFTPFETNCYVYVSQRMTFHDAEEYCYNNFDGHLTSVISTTEQDYMEDYAVQDTKDMWIGLSDTETPGLLKWSNGYDVLNFVNWDTGPTIIHAGSTCTEMISTTGKWNTTRCGENKAFVCKKGQKTTCPDGWIYGHGKCYEFHLNANLFTTWSEARDFCYLKNARILTIESQDEQNFIGGFSQQWNKDGIIQMWIGASDFVTDNVMTWWDGKTINYNQWDGDYTQILNTGVDDCAWLYTGKTSSNWEVGNCFQLLAFGCEVNEGISLSPEPRPLVNYTCEDGWRLFNGNCYFFSDIQKSWDDSKAFCNSAEQGYAKFVSIHNDLEQSFISGHLKGQSWIGLNDKLFNGIYQWSDGTPLDFLNWKFNQPEDNGDCIRIVGVDTDGAWGGWNDRNCSEKVFPICKRPAVSVTPHYPPTVDRFLIFIYQATDWVIPALSFNYEHSDPHESACGTNYIHYAAEHKCYKIETKYSRQWSDARLHCQQEGGDLLSINSPGEQAFIEYYIIYLDAIALWTGAIDTYNGPDFFPDVVDAFDGGWRWSDGSPFNYVNWMPGEPNNEADEDCVQIRTDRQGLWNDVPCDLYYPYICEKDDPEHHDEEPDVDCTTEDCCFRHIGVEVGGSVLDSQLSASSQWKDVSPAERGRLNMLDQHIGALDVGPGLGAWIAAETDPAPWIQVDLLDFYEIRGIVSQGRNGLSQPENQNDWVKQYSVKYLINHVKDVFEDYRELDGSITIYDANYDQDSQVTNLFTRPIVTSKIRILPTSCRHKCAMRIELIGCIPVCVNSLGVSNDVLDNTFPVLDDSSFSASSFQPGFEPYNARLDYAGEGLQNIQHYVLSSSTLTYDSARSYCVERGGDLCLAAEICPNGIPLITGIVSGDEWAPIRDGYNDWVEIGDDNGGAGRICTKHNDQYGPPSWGTQTGPCEDWATPQDDCPHKGNVFCCAVNLKAWKPVTNSKDEYVQVDLGEIRKVSGVIIQGNSELDEWVTDYKLAFSTDGNIFTKYKAADGGDLVFPGSFDRSTPVEGFLREAIPAQHLRIIPQAWNNNIAVRMDVIGCEVGNYVTCADTVATYADDTFVADCPAGCDAVTDKLWGTTVYTDDSYICAAAIHDGRIQADHGGTVTIKKAPGLDSYQGSVQHGITSNSFATWPGSFTFTGDHLGCPNGWVGWKDWCYYLTRKSSKVDYESANNMCQFYGGELASIHSEAEQDFVTSLIFYGYGSIDDVWIGFNDFESQNYYKWSDNSEVTYTRWNFNEPNGGEERCVHMYKWSGFWNDKKCDTVMNYVCKMEKIPINQAQEEVDGCQDGWLGNAASCYLFDVNPSVWVNAEDFCQTQGGHLVTVNDYYEQMYLTSQAAQTSHPNDQENFYIGLSAYVDKSGSMSFKWSSGEPVTFTAWGANEPYIAHQCSFPFQYEGVEYYDCIELGRPYELLGVPWCSADPIYTNHPVSCEGREDGQVGCIVMDKDTGFWSQANPVGCGSPEYRICETPRTGGFTTVSVPTPPSPTGNCPDGWWGWSNSTFCYQINQYADISLRLSWENAKLHCESMGANLVSIHSPEEERVIISGVSGDDYGFWIGLKRQEQDSLWGWSDKTPVSYTHWGTGEPNNMGGRENCVQGYYAPNNVLWNDNNCEGVKSWICKVERGKDLLPAVTPPPGTLSPQICGSDRPWVAFTNSRNEQKCYYFASSPIQSWHAANTECQSYGGELVAIATLDEQQFITGYAHKAGVSDFWIGLIQDGMDGPFLWVDGTTPLAFENFMGGQPENNNGHELCVEMMATSGLWSDNNCGISNGFICQKRVGAVASSPTPAPIVHGGCPTGWLPYGSKCFLEVGFTDRSLRATWADAETYCESKSGFLASLTNPYYNSFLTSKLFASPSNIWIGLNAIGTNRQFIWSDNSDVWYTNWASEEPNNQEGAEHCVEMIWTADKAGKWNDQRCDDVRPFYCSRLKDPDYTSDQSAAPDCPANRDFVQWDTGCYKVYTDTSQYKNWNDARSACQAEGRSLGIKEDLTSVWNVYENHFLISLFWPQENVVPFESMWMGMYYNESQGEIVFMWSDHSPVAYSNWDTDQPVDTGEGLGCGVVDQYGKWSMMKRSGGNSCGYSSLPYICKYETLEIPVQDPGVGTCEANWAGLGDYCYQVVTGANSGDQRSWGDADAECQANMAYLASTHSDLENKAFLSWTDQRNVWIGLKRNGWGGWEWSDDTGVDFTNWAEGEPNDSGETGEACVELWTNGYWNDRFCSDKMGYICRKHKMYSTCNYPIPDRVDCGYPGISQYECQQRLCCWDVAGTGPHMCYYSNADAACLEKGGKCVDYRQQKCELGYEQFLCTGDSNNRCCFECGETDNTCNTEVAGWEQGDSVCESGGYGNCQYNSNYCPSEVYETNKCGGPGNRQCCVTNPPTKPPDSVTTTTPTTTPPTQPPTNPGDTTTTPPSVVTTTTATTVTNKPTEEQIPKGNGLDAGGIAGIVIAVLFVVAAVGVGLFLYMRTENTKIPFAGLYGSKSTSAASGFDNPITYSNTKYMVSMENDYGEDEA